MAEKAGFKTVETDLEELEEKIQEHRRKIFRRVVRIIVIVIASVALIGLALGLRTYKSYEIKSSVDRNNSSASRFAEFNNKLVEYSNDGAVCMEADGTLVWNQAFEMTDPRIDKSDDYFAVYDKSGTDIFLMKDDSIENNIQTSMPIEKVSVANQGAIAVLMKDGTNYYIKLFDKSGEELAGGQYYSEQGSIPIDVALSPDGEKLAVDMIDISGGSVDTTIAFYNFGSVGQNEIDNNVGSYTYKNTVFPEVDYISESCAYAVGDTKILVFSGKQKPEVSKEIEYEGEISSVFHNSKYVGIAYSNNDEDNSHHIQVFDSKGKTVMEHDTDIQYQNIELLSNNEIVVTSNLECEIYTIHSIKKFHYEFDVPIYRVIYAGSSNDYIFVMEDATKEVRLR